MLLILLSSFVDRVSIVSRTIVRVMFRYFVNINQKQRGQFVSYRVCDITSFVVTGSFVAICKADSHN